jgi:hypothetical protein
VVVLFSHVQNVIMKNGIVMTDQQSKSASVDIQIVAMVT